MTERRLRGLAAVDAARRRHRQSILGGVVRMPVRPATRALLFSTAVGAVVATMFAYGATGSPEPGELPPPAAVLPLDPVGSVGVVPPPPPTATPGTGTPTPPTAAPGTGGSLSAEPSPSPTTDQPTRPAPSTRPAPPPTAAPGGGAQGAGGAGDPGTTAPAPPPPPPPPPPAPPAPPAPRVVGPTSLDGFDSFLDAHCEDRGFRGALLLNGRRTPTTGRWVCAKFSDLDTIDLNDACRDGFGGSARAREVTAGDIRTVRCFDS